MRAYRIAATGLCFTGFYLGGFLLALVWFNLLRLWCFDRQKRQKAVRASLSLSFRFFLRLLDVLGLTKIESSNIEKLRSDRGCIIVANHPSLIDYVIMAALLKEVNCVFKAELKHHFFFKGVIKAAGYLANDDPGELMEESRACLEEGQNILIFPEGTRTNRQEPIKLHKGAAALAVALDRPLRIVTIGCFEEFLSKQKRWYDVPSQTPVYTVTALDKLNWADFMEEPGDKEFLGLMCRRINRHLTSVFNQVYA